MLSGNAALDSGSRGPVVHSCTSGSQKNYEKENDWENIEDHCDKKLLQRCAGSTEHLLEDFEKAMKDKVCKHLFNIQHQYTQLQSLHRSLKEDEVIFHFDYAENWQRKCTKEVQQIHVLKHLINRQHCPMLFCTP